MHKNSAQSKPASTENTPSGDHEPVRAMIALGANLAHEETGPRASLEAALAAMQDAGMRVIAHSRWYASAAYPAGSGPDFVNGAALVDASLAPFEFLERLHDIEAELGRVRGVRWAPRACDLDLLAIGDLVLPDAETVGRWMKLDLGAAQTVTPERLILPHPRMHERAFVLMPLVEIAPNWCHPLTGLSVRQMCASLPDALRAEVRPMR